VRRARPTDGGFTLLEIVVAIGILAMMMSFVYEVLTKAVATRDTLTEGLEGPKTENAILGEILSDLRFIYYRPGQFANNAGFWGRNRQVAGKEADRIDFLTCRASRTAELEDAGDLRRPVNAPIVEVGYACRPSDAKPEWIELWRRERYFVDDDPTDGGRYDLVYDKLRAFDLEYYEPAEKRVQGSRGLEEWDSKTQKSLPAAIVLRLEFDVREPIAKDQPQGMVRRIVLLPPSRSVPPDTPGMDAGSPAMR